MKFQELVWNLLKEIPKGKITTYKIIAEKIGSRGYRAVGNACKRNPYAPTIPCHRVVNSNGKIGGYGGETSGEQTNKKIQMLMKEGIQVKDNKVVNLEKFLYRFERDSTRLLPIY